MFSQHIFSLSFFFNDTATTEIYTLSLHDALPIWRPAAKTSIARLRPAARTSEDRCRCAEAQTATLFALAGELDRKSTRLNSSHVEISYAVFCLKKKKKRKLQTHTHTTHSHALTKP